MSGGHLDIVSKIMSLAQAVEWRGQLREKGLRLVFTNGCFDLLHRGHAEYLLAARKMGDALVLALNSDNSVRSLKGPTRPVNAEADRAFVAASLACVDAVLVFDSVRCDKLIAAIKPDIYAKGGDYTVETLDKDERAALMAAAAEIRFIPFVDGHSSSSMIEKMR